MPRGVSKKKSSPLKRALNEITTRHEMLTATAEETTRVYY